MANACALRAGYRRLQTEYVIRIAFPLQQWFHERASVLRYAYIGGLMGAAMHNHNA